MKNNLLFWCFFLSNLSFSQSEFIVEARYHLPRKDSLFEFESGFSGSGEYNYFSDSTLQLEFMFNKLLKKGNRNRTDTLKQSLVLTQLATLCMKRIPSINPANSRRKKDWKNAFAAYFSDPAAVSD